MAQIGALAELALNIPWIGIRAGDAENSRSTEARIPGF
jgi:hypothetical protein